MENLCWNRLLAGLRSVKTEAHAEAGLLAGFVIPQGSQAVSKALHPMEESFPGAVLKNYSSWEGFMMCGGLPPMDGSQAGDPSRWSLEGL